MIHQLSQVFMITLALLFCAGEARRIRYSQDVIAAYEEPSFLAVSTDSAKSGCASGSCGFADNFTKIRRNRTSFLEESSLSDEEEDLSFLELPTGNNQHSIKGSGAPIIIVTPPKDLTNNLLEAPFNGTSNTFSSVYNVTYFRNNRTSLLEEESEEE